MPSVLRQGTPVQLNGLTSLTDAANRVVAYEIWVTAPASGLTMGGVDGAVIPGGATMFLTSTKNDGNRPVELWSDYLFFQGTDTETINWSYMSNEPQRT